MKTFLDYFAGVVGVATVALLSMSVSHEYGYFWAIGRHFQTFITTSDYFSNAVLWLPAMVVILYGVLDWKVLLGMRRYEPIGFNWQGVGWIVVLIVFPVAVSFFIPFSPSTYIGSLIVIWLMYGSKKLPFAEANSELLRYLRRILIVVPVVMAVLFAWGYSRGEGDLGSFAEPYTLEMKKGDDLHRIILRTFDKGILVRDAVENRIEFIRWEDITKVSRRAMPSQLPLSCSWFRINCSVPSTP